MMLKLYKSKILDQYGLFNSSIIAFDVKSVEEKKFLFAFGSDINEDISTPSEPDAQKTQTKSEKVAISSLKIFDITSVLDTNNEGQPELVRTINVMKTENGSLSSNTSGTKDISNVLCFCISEDISAAAIGCENGDVIVIKGNLNLLSEKECDLGLLKTEENISVTNIAFSMQKDLYVTFSTTKDIFIIK